MRRGIFLMVVLAVGGAVPVWSKDFGQQGAVFAVIEPDLLAVIEARLRHTEASGKIAAMNRQLAARTTAAVKRPPPVLGMTATSEARSWTYDPTITVEQDIRDHQGNLIIAAGQRINPLASVGLRQSLVFLDGDDPAQLAWALRSTTQLNAKLILTSGSPFDAMKGAQRRFFFDQGGKLTAKFGIRHVPAVVEQDGAVLKITEVVVAPKPRGRAGR